MLPRPSCPRAVQSGLWQNWLRGSIGVSPRDTVWRPCLEECLVGPRFSSPYPSNHGSMGCYPGRMELKKRLWQGHLRLSGRMEGEKARVLSRLAQQGATAWGEAL